MNTITIEYFAILRDESACNTEQIVTAAETPTQIYHELRDKYSFSLYPKDLKVAINDVFVSWDTQLNDGDKIVFIPPVSGG